MPATVGPALSDQHVEQHTEEAVVTSRSLAAAGLATGLLAVTACGGGGSGTSDEPPENLTVWLMPEAKENWPDAIERANQTFEEQHPRITVQVRYQDWSQYLTKFEASMGGGEPPDVLEMGNTQTAKYMASGALLDISDQKDSFDNSGSWLGALEDSCTYQRKLYCVPYYAAARAMLYRTDMFEKAGVSGEPSSLEEFDQAAQALMDEYGERSNFSAYFFPGKYWYAAMSFVYDYGGQIAVRENGQWRGALDSPQAREALTRMNELVSEYSRASKTSDEEDRNQVFAEGNVATLYAVSYDYGVITGEEQGDPELADDLGAFPMPSHNAGEVMPSFLGGSDLAVPSASDAPDLALDWIRTFTSNTSMTMMAESSNVLPNTTTLLDQAGGDEIADAFATAAQQTWFVPSAKNWATVEQRNVIPNMLVSIFTGDATVDEATAQASQEITRILNE